MQRIRAFVHRGIATLGSLRLSIALVALLIVACTVGGLVPQSPVTSDADAIYRSYGSFWFRVITRLQLDDVFGSTWFFALVSAFALNLLCCTSRRLRTSLRRAFRSPQYLGAGIETGYTIKLQVPGSPSELVGLVQETLRRSGFSRIGRRLGSDESIHICGFRRHWAVLGADVVHIGILIILAGALLGIFREEGSLRINEWQIGELQAVCDADAGACALATNEVQVVGFGVETYEGTSRVKDYWADVVLWDDDRIATQSRISVNRPLHTKGTGIFVWRYGQDPNAALLQLHVVDTTRNLVTSEIELRVGETVQIPGSQARVTAVRFDPAFDPGDAGIAFAADEIAEATSAAQLQIQLAEANGQSSAYRDIAFPFLPRRDAQGENELAFLLVDVGFPSYIDLRITRNPGYPFFWWGFILVMVGLAVAFYLRAATVYVTIQTDSIRVCPAGRGSSLRAERVAEDIATGIERDLEQEGDK